MPAKDFYHDTVCTALIKDGWTITDDPLILKIGRRSVFVDLGAEKLIAAQRDSEKIAVEIKSFLSPSPINDLLQKWIFAPLTPQFWGEIESSSPSELGDLGGIIGLMQEV